MESEGKVPDELWEETCSIIEEEEEEEEKDDDDVSETLRAGDTMTHQVFGAGVIVGISNDRATYEVKFGCGTRMIARPYITRVENN